MGLVWEANHVWLIFVLVVCWTAYPVAFGSITSTLGAPLLIAAIGIIFRGAAYALRGEGASRAAENLFAVSSILVFSGYHAGQAAEAAVPEEHPSEGGGAWPQPRTRTLGTAAVAGLAAGTGLLVFADPAWAHVVGVAGLVLCAVSVFLLLAAAPPAHD